MSPQHVLRAGAAVSNQCWPGQAHSSPRQEEEATRQEGSSCSSDRGSSASASRGSCCVHLSTCGTCSTGQHSVTACSSSTGSSGTSSTSTSSAYYCQGCFQALGLQAADVKGETSMQQACIVQALDACMRVLHASCHVPTSGRLLWAESKQASNCSCSWRVSACWQRSSVPAPWHRCSRRCFRAQPTKVKGSTRRQTAEGCAGVWVCVCQLWGAWHAAAIHRPLHSGLGCVSTSASRGPLIPDNPTLVWRSLC